jgi:hypothetical protein
MTFFHAAGLALVASIAALFIRDSDAAGTMHPKAAPTASATPAP